MKNVTVLLSTYNGYKHLEQQIHSILIQMHVNITLFIRDDGSTDEKTIEMLKQYEKMDNVYVEYSNNIGAAKSFWSLIQNTKHADYYAFCDQDDQWDNDKMMSAINKLGDSEKPMLYCSNVRVVDENFNYIREFITREKPSHYLTMLISGFAPGCGFVFNQAACNELKKYHGLNINHDMTAISIIESIGEVVYDNKSHMAYRQHANNLVGAVQKTSFIKSIKRNIKYILKTEQFSDIASDILKTYEDISQSKKEILESLANYKNDRKSKRKLIQFLKESNYDPKKLFWIKIKIKKL